MANPSNVLSIGSLPDPHLHFALERGGRTGEWGQ